MSMNKKYGTAAVDEFWNFVAHVNFNSTANDAVAVKMTLLKQLSPTTASKYKEICDDLAYTLSVPSIPNSLYAAYDVIAKGYEHYQDYLHSPDLLATQQAAPNLNHFGNIFPTEDDYYSTTVADINLYRVDDFDLYD